MQLRYDFHQLRMEDEDEDPDEWITKLEIIRRKLIALGVKMDEEEIILQVLQNLPSQYEAVITICEDDLSNGLLSLESLRERLRSKYNRIRKEKKESDEAVALMMTRKFKGMCNVCGKIGHKGTDCFTLPKNKTQERSFLQRSGKEKRQKR